MSLPKRVSLPQPPQPNLKHRVITCLNKLSDRDTLAVATTELESIAINLSHDTFAPFLTCLSATSSSEKSPVRKQCVRLLGILSATHGDSLSPHLSKMIAAVLRRLRDPDSAVRAACVDSISSMASQITKPPFSSLSKPLVESILTEQDYNAQIGLALCLSAAIEASPDPESVLLQKLLPRFLKLIKTDCFKAKPALLSLIGSIVSACGGALNRNSLNCVVPCLVEFLSSEDWAARKAAVEALEKLAVAEKSNLGVFKSSCVASLESKRFDKVKVVRETMNRALVLWKEIPGAVEEVSPQSTINSSSKGSGCGRYSVTISKGPNASGFETPPKETIPINRSPSSSSPSTRSPLRSNNRKLSAPIVRKVDFNKQTDWKVDVAVPRSPSPEIVCKDNFRSKETGIPDTVKSESCTILETEKRVAEQVISNKTGNGRFGKVGGLRFGSRVVPFHDNCKLDMVLDGNATEDVYGSQKEVEDLSLIQKQLVQIENQQSSLLNLLQKFIGSSRNGMDSLETRVNGLEKALDEISYDLAISTGRISNTDSSGNTCCMLPGAEFLSPKFWRKTEGQFPTSRLSFRGRSQSLTDRHSLADKDSIAEANKLGSPMGQQKSFRNSVRSLESLPNTQKKINQNGEMVQICNSSRFDGGSFANCIQQQT